MRRRCPDCDGKLVLIAYHWRCSECAHGWPRHKDANDLTAHPGPRQADRTAHTTTQPVSMGEMEARIRELGKRSRYSKVRVRKVEDG